FIDSRCPSREANGRRLSLSLCRREVRVWAERGSVPDLLLLDGGCPRPDGAAGCGGGTFQPYHDGGEQPRAVCRRVRRPIANHARQLPASPHPPGTVGGGSQPRSGLGRGQGRTKTTPSMAAGYSELPSLACTRLSSLFQVACASQK